MKKKGQTEDKKIKNCNYEKKRHCYCYSIVQCKYAECTVSKHCSDIAAFYIYKRYILFQVNIRIYSIAFYTSVIFCLSTREIQFYQVHKQQWESLSFQVEIGRAHV